MLCFYFIVPSCVSSAKEKLTNESSENDLASAHPTLRLCSGIQMIPNKVFCVLSKTKFQVQSEIQLIVRFCINRCFIIIPLFEVLNKLLKIKKK